MEASLEAKLVTPVAVGSRPVARRMSTLVDRCQVLLGRSSETSPFALIGEMNGLVAQLPTSLSRAEQLMISGIFGHLLARLTRAAGIDDRLDVAREFLDLAEAGPTMESWRLQWFRSTESCAALVPIDIDSGDHQVTDTRVARMVRLIQRRYADPKLKMPEVASVVNLGPGHARRLLRRETGSSFHEHLHRCRAVAGRRLLVESPLSIKEIAADVGYAHHSQFSRRFKVAYGETPIAFRTGRIRPLSK